eukprot:CAMPEP_0175157362 /NCGR_PEP_ID=MMETSP0087-20121206/22163_1 /TAXON_ID=136419 /ORGANISM="Unknown Unknown, Strain D1" /LENGTH=223 /DNA_ID=CAMNT_0016444969 /DNA_START=6 /DNA_END=676 /DNA_ORIENTATION=-
MGMSPGSSGPDKPGEANIPWVRKKLNVYLALLYLRVLKSDNWPATWAVKLSSEEKEKSPQSCLTDDSNSGADRSFSSEVHPFVSEPKTIQSLASLVSHYPKAAKSNFSPESKTISSHQQLEASPEPPVVREQVSSDQTRNFSAASFWHDAIPTNQGRAASPERLVLPGFSGNASVSPPRLPPDSCGEDSVSEEPIPENRFRYDVDQRRKLEHIEVEISKLWEV